MKNSISTSVSEEKSKDSLKFHLMMQLKIGVCSNIPSSHTKTLLISKHWFLKVFNRCCRNLLNQKFQNPQFFYDKISEQTLNTTQHSNNLILSPFPLMKNSVPAAVFRAFRESLWIDRNRSWTILLPRNISNSDGFWFCFIVKLLKCLSKFLIWFLCCGEGERGRGFWNKSVFLSISSRST